MTSRKNAAETRVAARAGRIHALLGRGRQAGDRSGMS